MKRVAGPEAGVEARLREVIEALAPLEREAGSAGERQAAEWLTDRLRQTGCAVQIDEEEFLPGYARPMATLSAAGAAAGALAGSRRGRKLGAAAAATVAALIADDISNGPRFFRRWTSRPQRTWNVVASCGDPQGERTLVVLGHHDAAPTGLIFDDRAQVAVGEALPGVLERIDTSLPLWWAVLAGPALAAAGASRGKPGLRRVGTLGSLLSAAVFTDVARGTLSPGANDNLTAVAVLVGLAEELSERPTEGLRVLLASCGAEEVIQGGIYGFVERHLRPLDRDRTWVLNLDTVGSPRLLMLEGEGPVVMEDYHDREFRDLIARVADRAGIPLRRRMRSRNSTDAVIPSRAGYPTAALTSADRYKALSNYHKVTDVPENLDLTTVQQALALTLEVARELGSNPWLGRPTRSPTGGGLPARSATGDGLPARSPTDGPFPTRGAS